MKAHWHCHPGCRTYHHGGRRRSCIGLRGDHPMLTWQRCTLSRAQCRSERPETRVTA